jgi:zinc transport system substrate-binding protein
VVSRDAGQVRLLDTGVVAEDHGDHSAMSLQASALLPGAASGDRPVHFNMDAARVAVFWDGTGIATLHDASAAATGDLAPVMTIQRGAPHHGVAVPVGAFTIATVAPEGEGLPDVLAVLGPDGAELSRVDCLNLHGEGKPGGYVALGCEDGVAIFDTSVTPPAGRFVAYPEEAPAAGMIRQLLGPRDTMALVGNRGAAHMAIFDPSSETGDFVFAEFPAARMAWALDATGMEGFAILADGRLVRFSALTGRILGQAPGVTRVYSMEQGAVRPMMAVAGRRVAVSDPAAGQVVMVDADRLEIVDRVDLGGRPQSLLLLTAEARHAH